MSHQPTIVFDLDGTLADTLHDLVPALNRTLVERNIDAVSADQVGYFTGRGGLKEMITHALQSTGAPLNQQLLDEVFVASLADYEQNIAVNTVIYPGVRDCLEQFADHGWLLGVCTNKPVGLADKLLHELEMDQLFAAVIGGDSFDFKKPDPRHLIRTIEIAGGLPSKAIMVGDTRNDILAAKQANVPVIGVDFGYSEHPLETYSPDRVISSFDSLFAEAVQLSAR